MRTDAKIGFAIGAVLLAVLTVYAIVVPRHGKKTTTPVTLVTPTGVTQTGVTPTASSGSSDPSSPPIAAADGGNNSPTPATSTALPTKEPVKDPATGDPGTTAGNTVPGNNTAGNNTAGNNTLVDNLPDRDGFHPLTGNTDKPKTEEHKPVHLHDDVYTPDGRHRIGTVYPPGHDDVDPIPTGDRVYEIKSGQTLSKIAYEVYGNSRFWVAIQRENKGLDPNHLKVGAKINLPDISPEQPVVVSDEQAVIPPTPAPTRSRVVTAVADAHSYIVKSGDTLYAIAKRILGSGRKADAIYALNKDLIGPDKSRLKLGMVLKMPETAATPAGAER